MLSLIPVAASFLAPIRCRVHGPIASSTSTVPKCLLAVSRATRSLVLHSFVAHTQDVLTQALWLKEHTVGIVVRSAADVGELRTLVADAHTVTFDDDAAVEAYDAVSRAFPNISAMYGVKMTAETAPHVATMARLETLHCASWNTLSLQMTGIPRLSSLHCAAPPDTNVDEFLVFVADCPLLIDLELRIVSATLTTVAGRDALVQLLHRKHLASRWCKTLAIIVCNTFHTATTRHLVDTDIVRSAIRRMLENSIDEGTLVETLSITSLAYPIQQFLQCLPTTLEACVASFPLESPYAESNIAEHHLVLIITRIEQCCPEMIPYMSTIKTRDWLLSQISSAQSDSAVRRFTSILQRLLEICPDLRAHFNTSKTFDWFMTEFGKPGQCAHSTLACSVLPTLLTRCPDLHAQFSTVKTRDCLLTMIGNTQSFFTLHEYALMLQRVLTCCPALQEHFSTLEMRNWLTAKMSGSQSRSMLDGFALILESLFNTCPKLRVHFSTIETRDWVFATICHALSASVLEGVASVLNALLKGCPDLQTHFSTLETRDWVAANLMRGEGQHDYMQLGFAMILKSLFNGCPDLQNRLSTDETRDWLTAMSRLYKR